jgi:hypothetical protein
MVIGMLIAHRYDVSAVIVDRREVGEATRLGKATGLS